MSFEPAVSLTEQIADHLSSEIIHGRLAPMARIQELKVAGDLGVSRGSVREALLILQRRHLIDIIPRRGAVVSCMESAEIANFSDLYTQLQISLFRAIASQKPRQMPAEAFARAIDHMVEGVNQADESTVLEARKNFLVAGLPLRDNYYLGSVLQGLVPAGMRLAHLATLHPDYDARDTVRYYRALLQAMSARSDERIGELVCAYQSREKKLALSCGQAGRKTVATSIRL